VIIFSETLGTRLVLKENGLDFDAMRTRQIRTRRTNELVTYIANLT